MLGFIERLDGELKAAVRTCASTSLQSLAHRMQLVSGAPTERKYGAWLGASILACMGSHLQMWMSREEYDEHGPNLILKKGLNYVW